MLCHPRHPCGWRPRGYFSLSTGDKFLSTPPVWVATPRTPQTRPQRPRFYPRHPCGWRLFLGRGGEGQNAFLSTPPVWVATTGWKTAQFCPHSFYPRHPCGWRRNYAPGGPQRLRVSIHATRVGGDDVGLVLKCAVIRFLSTPPVWVATCDSDGSRAAY